MAEVAASQGPALDSEDQEVLDRIVADLEARPQLAFALASWMIPNLTFAPTAAITGSGARRFVGHILPANPQKVQFSFIQCPEIQELFGSDVFLHSAQRGSFRDNAQVCFAVLLNKNGKPQAFDLTVPSEYDLSNSPSAAASAAASAATAMTARSWAQPWPKQEYAAAVAPAVAAAPVVAVAPREKRYTGVISDFTPGLYGFIQCPEIQQMYGKDVWLHHKQILHFNVGDSVTFVLNMNKNGQPQAIDLKDARAAAKTHAFPIGTKKRPAVVVPAVNPAVQANSERYIGTITSWRPGGMFGFITCDETHAIYGKDVWVHSAQIGNFYNGEVVSFTLILNKDGNPQAIDLQPANGASFQKRLRTG